MTAVEPSSSWEERQRRFKHFKTGVFNIMKVALASDITTEALAQIKKDVILTIDPEARAEMLCYTNDIEITVIGGQRKTGWWWGKKTVWKNITVDILFNPYRTSLSAWTDPKAPDGIVLFS